MDTGRLRRRMNCSVCGAPEEHFTGEDCVDHLLSRLEAFGAVVGEIAAERRRQIEREGYTTAHDDEHDRGELAYAAAAYVVVDLPSHHGAETFWPWDDGFKPKDRRSNLVRAAALLVAEIERLDRLPRED